MANLKFDFLHAYETGERRESEPANAYQYDEGHVLEAVLPSAVTSCEIHYWIRGQEKSEAYTPGSITQNADGSCTVIGNIPNLYFETNGELRVYIVVTDGSASITTYEGYVHICQRSMPDDYVDDDPENEATRVLIEAQTAAATATAAAETCEEVRESIPEDYSQLSEDVDTLKDGLSDMDDRVTALEQGGTGSGITDDIKLALLQIASKVAYIDEDGQDYYDALNDALYPPADLVSISAVYTQSETVYETDSLNSLRSDLVVTAHMSDGTTQEVITYTLSGTLAEGTSTITASYGGKTTTFSVIVSSFPTISWGLSKGALPSADDGITTTDTSGKFTTSYSSTNGITLTGTGTTGDTVRYLPTDYNTAKKAVCETVFTITSIHGSSAGNFSILLSNGTSGVNLQFVDKAQNVGKVISYINGSQSSSLVNIGTWDLNTEYIVRCEYVENGTNKIYLNGSLLYESNAVSSYYTTVNRIHAAGIISVNIKSFKWIIQEAI